MVKIFSPLFDFTVFIIVKTKYKEVKSQIYKNMKIFDFIFKIFINYKRIKKNESKY